MSIKKRIKKALNYLQVAYRAQIIGYPRVDNDFKREAGSMDTFPHPTLPSAIGKRFKPFSTRKSVTVNKEEMILFLSSTHVITPSQIESVYDYLDYYLDDELLARDQEKQMEINKIIEAIEAFFQKHNLNKKELIDMRRSLLKNARIKNEESMLFAQKEIYFFKGGEGPKLMAGNWKRKANKQASSKKRDKFGGVIESESIMEAIETFQESKREKSFAVNIVEENTVNIQDRGL